VLKNTKTHNMLQPQSTSVLGIRSTHYSSTNTTKLAMYHQKKLTWPLSDTH